MLRYLLILLLLSGLSGLATASIDTCLSLVENLSHQATHNGLKVGSNSLLTKAVSSCRKAERQSPDSPTIKLSLAKALIWSGKLSEAFVRLESVIEEEEESSELAAMICASKGAPSRVRNKACSWVSEYGAGDSALVLSSAKQLLSEGKVEEYLNLLGQAVKGGSTAALQEAADICLVFDSNNPELVTKKHSAFRNIDPIYIAALTCESVISVLSPGDKGWATIGFNYATLMLYYSDYDSVGEILLILGSSNDPDTESDAIWMAVGLCMAEAGHPEDPAAKGRGVHESEVLVENARPICEVAAYLDPQNSSLHLNLSRIYELEGDELSYNAALAEAIRLGNLVAHPFNPEDYSASDLLAAFYHGDRTSIYLLAPRNHELVDVFYGKETNMFLLSYLEKFISTSMSGKEDFFCERESDVYFKGEATYAIAKMRMEMEQEALFKMVGSMLDKQKGEQFLNESFGAMFKNGNMSAMYDDWKSSKLNMSKAGHYASRDADTFVKKLGCEEPGRPLVENMTAFVEGRPMPHRDLFYHSRYDKKSGAKLFYDQCGNYLIAQGRGDLKASAQCHCMVQNLYGSGMPNSRFFDLASKLARSFKNPDDRVLSQAVEQCEVI